ncbi:serine/threonine-protein kinase [Paenibacillus periandrae]|uniref:serine/threonine-protein kinase n=1 Tax=Paenibacillus periandrae TaxID=1761741 RepID=UPI001F09F63F|nr:serine/threonine-protein kinase [Paenibacillus periandrae]
MSEKFSWVESIYETKISTINKYMDIQNNRPIVIKEIKGMDHISSLFFEREIGALKVLNNHDNVVKMYDYEIEQTNDGNSLGRIYLEYIEGMNLQNINNTLIDKVEKNNIMFHIVDAVETAHNLSIVHRDIKPNNVMIEDYRKAKLIDFGLSKIKGQISKETVGHYGTNLYMAPEVSYHGDNASFQSDIYSIGATIYYLHTGEEPPLPESFAAEIKNTSGMIPELKDILIKSVQLLPTDRYESVTDLKRALNSIYRELYAESKYLVTFPHSILAQARNRKLIPATHGISDFIKLSLNKWFQIPFAFIDSKLEEPELNKQHDITIFSDMGYKLKCSYNSYEEHFIVEDISNITPNNRKAILNKCMKISGSLLFVPSSEIKSIREHKTYEIVNDLISHRMEYQSDENKQYEFERFFGIWFEYLDKEKELIIDSARKVNYTSLVLNKEERLLEFAIENTNIEELGFSIDSTLLFDPILNAGEKKRKKPAVVGTFKEIVVKNNKAIMLVKYENESVRLPDAGTLVEDYNLSMFLIDKQKKALWALSANEFECNENLKEVVLGFEQPTSLDKFAKIAFINKKLDLNQKETVRRVLSTSSISVIQGPPGTGKTSVIREIVNQILIENSSDLSHRNSKILIVSQSHTAVDHVLEGLLTDQTISNTKILRIGSNENIIPGIWERFGLSNVHSKWVENTVAASNERLQELTTLNGIDQDHLRKYCDLKFRSNFTEENIEDNNFIIEFEESYKDDPDKMRVIQTAIIQHDWSNRIRTANDSVARLIENATIVAGTCTGYNSNPAVKNLSFDYVIVDEAAKASVPELLIPLLKGSRLILVGDHNQLPPTLKKEVIDRCNVKQEVFETGLFKHLFDRLPVTNKFRLSMQYRMHKTIGNMISNVFYENTIDTGIDDAERLHDLTCFQDTQIAWISTSKLSESDRRQKQVSGTTSYSNKSEHNIIKKVLQTIDKEKSAENYEIAVITGYSAQKSLIRDSVNRADYSNIKEIEVNTVDSYQGRDKDIVIFSTVRSDGIGFQKSEKRINVALSRARRLLIIVGDLDLFQNNRDDTNRFPQIIEYMRQTPGCKIYDYEVFNE